MARRHRSRSSRIGGARALFPLSGLLGSAVLGIGAAALARKFIGAPLGAYTGAAVGFAVGGIGGAAGAYVNENVLAGSAQTSGAGAP